MRYSKWPGFKPLVNPLRADPLQEKYGFKAHEFHAAGFASAEEYRAAHGSDLFLVDIQLYDNICKVLPRPHGLLPVPRGPQPCVSAMKPSLEHKGRLSALSRGAARRWSRSTARLNRWRWTA